MAAGAEGGGGETADFPDAWHKLEKKMDNVKEEVGNLQALFQDFKKELGDFKMIWRETMADLKEVADIKETFSKEAVQEEQLLAVRPKMKRENYKMASTEGKEREKKKIMEQKTLLNFGLNLTKNEDKREETSKRKRSPEGRAGLEQKNRASSNTKKKKLQEEFYEKKKKETKEAG